MNYYPNSLSFGKVLIGCDSTLQFYIENNGVDTLKIKYYYIKLIQHKD